MNKNFHLSKRTGTKRILVDIDETICEYDEERRYNLAKPIAKNIDKINRLYDQGYEIIYWTGRGAVSGLDYTKFTLEQLRSWGCKFHDLWTGTSEVYPKPAFDMIIDDKAKQIEDL